MVEVGANGGQQQRRGNEEQDRRHHDADQRQLGLGATPEEIRIAVHHQRDANEGEQRQQAEPGGAGILAYLLDVVEAVLLVGVGCPRLFGDGGSTLERNPISLHHILQLRSSSDTRLA